MKAFRLGKPVSSGAVIEKPAKFNADFELDNWMITKTRNSTTLNFIMKENDLILGLGEQLGGINKRGRKYITYNHDTPEHTPDVLALYGSHPFLIIKSVKDQGIFIDFPGEIIFDLGFSRPDMITITIASADFDLYYWSDIAWQDIVRNYIELTGGVYVPPKWAFGYQQSRWSYQDADSVRCVAEMFRKLGIPCDAVYLDIDYMQDYKVFTIHQERFPAFKEFVSELKQKGFHLVPIIDPGIKIAQNYRIYEEGHQKKYFCTDDHGKEFQAAVWPGITALPDFSSEIVRSWWGALFDDLIDLGIEGFWNDMNEPAIFFSVNRQNEVHKMLTAASDKKELDKINLNDLHWQIRNLPNNRSDYKSIFQHPEPDKSICHDNIHNLYGAQMTQALAEYVQINYPHNRFLIFSRSSYSGMQRYAGIWFGDNKSWWAHLELNIKLLINCNLAGFLYSGADIGGFGSDCQAELLVRWLQLGLLSPLFRNHSAIHTRRQELWEFDPQTLATSRNIIRLRYALLPWLYSSFLQYAGMNTPLIRPLFWDFEDSRCLQIEDQFLYGDSIMAAPVYKANARGRYVYLPQLKWLCWQARSWEDRNPLVLSPGDHFLDCPLDRQLIFLRQNTLIAFQEPEDFVGQRQPDTLIITGMVTSQAELKLLEDQGKFPAFSGMSVLEINVSKLEYEYDITISCIKKAALHWQYLVFELYDAEGRLSIIHKRI